MSEVLNVEEIFGSKVFTLGKMRERLPKSVYKEVKKIIDHGGELSLATADVVAKAMKDWAIENGATHYTHWFQPLTGITAEKHDAFVTHPDEYGKMIMEFSGKELIKGEPDASSFPSGGLRATFEARGYTAWDITSPAFLKEDATGVILCIPTAFCSYKGEALDKKTPLLRSMEAVSTQALRIVRLFGNTEATKVVASVGPEQEYFLVDRDKYLQRKDLIYTGRTLFGAMPPKGQEMEDHYFGALKPRVSAYMHDLDLELWKLGIPAKTKHNEVAPAQHELAPIFTTSNIAADHNQLTMEIMKKVALKHGLVCLLHEKPFAGVNGSGKHNNWSISSNDGQNLLDPGDTPMENMQFLTFLCAIIRGVDEYAPLLRISAASAGNDHRLGANEAPPAIISVFVGDELQRVLDAIENGTSVEPNSDKTFEIGVDALPNFPKDTTDRNRTSPYAFTGNKFEFRMLGSADSISCTNVMMNTIFAQILSEFADELEKADDFKEALKKLLVKTIREHKRVIFNGNGYSDEWIEEAAKRGLPNLVSTVDALPHYIDDKYVSMFEKFKVYTRAEIASRMDILLENYSKVINIEALTMLDMAKKSILPAAIEYTKEMCDTVASMKAVGVDTSLEVSMANKLSALTVSLSNAIETLDSKRIASKDYEDDVLKTARYYRDEIFAAMQSLRAVADELEMCVPEKYWPFPTYTDLLFTV